MTSLLMMQKRERRIHDFILFVLDVFRICIASSENDQEMKTRRVRIFHDANDGLVSNKRKHLHCARCKMQRQSNVYNHHGFFHRRSILLWIPNGHRTSFPTSNLSSREGCTHPSSYPKKQKKPSYLLRKEKQAQRTARARVPLPLELSFRHP